ncbi:MAG: uracil-DNA glycosylase [Bacteroidia bacterium]|nr:MAG: uracil-DNA glycosylase [Bacteroidia bacterium]
MEVQIQESWKNLLADEFKKDYFSELVDFVKKEYAAHKIYPRGANIFKAFDLCPPEKVKLVILGQDPYHGEGQAHGLCFSVPEGVAVPPSLLNIYKELHADIGKEIPPSGNLEHWAKQGVLMLNATLTVRARQAGSHKGKGWEIFTDAVIQKIAETNPHLVFLLWGAYAQKKAQFIDRQKHLILQAAHPSPLSAHRGFMGCKHFSKANDYLEKQGKIPINW